MTTTRGVLVGVLAATLLLGTMWAGHAEDAGKPGLSTSGSLREALGRLGEGRDVELVLSNGKSYRGTLGSVGSATVIVSQIAGKEFSDVLIALDAVAAVEVRVRSN